MTKSTLLLCFISGITFSVINPKSSPPITNLPFGLKSGLYNSSNTYYSKLIYKDISRLMDKGWDEDARKETKIYQLPIINNINYIGLSNVDTDKCENGQLFSKYFKISKYRYRLPNINKYQCYYWCNYDSKNNEYSNLAKNNCDWCILNSFYGYLVLYDVKIRTANVVAIYFDIYRDGYNHSRNFYIDKNYNINLADFLQEADDGDGSHPSKVRIGERHIISVLKNGTIQVRKVMGKNRLK